MKNRWGADPEKYRRLSTPFESEDEARKATDGFLDELARLREKYHVPELVCQFQVYVKMPEENVGSLVGGAGWGDQLRQAKLAKRMADREFDATLQMIQTLSEHSNALAEMLITDPSSVQERYTEEQS